MSVLFNNRADAGGQLAEALAHLSLEGMLVVGLARGGVPVAVEVASRFSLPLDALAVRKVSHPRQPEYGIGGVTPTRDGVYIRSNDGLTEDELHRAIEVACSKAAALDIVLHRNLPPLDPRGRSVLLIDDGLATGATMVAAVRWARLGGATRAIVAVPVAAASSIRFLRHEADDVVCPHVPQRFRAVGDWYQNFDPVSDEDVVTLLNRFKALGHDD